MDSNLTTRLGERIRSTTAGDEPFWSYIPKPLPPKPPLDVGKFQNLLERASQSLGKLDGLTTVLPDTHLFLYVYVRKEAVLSSQIEGTQSSLSDLLLYESESAPGIPLGDVQEVSNYVAAMTHSLNRMQEGFPLSMRLIKEMHNILLAGSRGSGKAPGEFRRTQNWIGGSRPGNAIYVPPPPDRVLDCMSDLEKFFHDQDHNLPVLVKTALVHHQFETIHPFLDGNGRLGRLLITLLLCHEKVLSEPLLYLSLYFKINRQEYYSQLQQVRETGDWESWLDFFLRGIVDVSAQACEAARQILKLIETNRNRISKSGRAAGSLLQIHRYLERKPLATIAGIVKALGLSTPTTTAALKYLEKEKIVREITGKQRKRVFVYDEYMRILEQGTAPLPE